MPLPDRLTDALRTWLGHRPRARRRPCRPAVERIEDRVLPAIVPVTLADPRAAVGGGNNHSTTTPFCLSADGRTVGFVSNAGNLLPVEPHGPLRYSPTQAYVRDLATGALTRVSATADGAAANDDTFGLALSGDGRLAAFGSFATNLTAGDFNREADLFLKDRATGAVTLLTVGVDGPANGSSFHPALSADGRFVAFESYASNLVPDDTNGAADVFLLDRTTGQVTLVSAGAAGPGNADATNAALSADGRVVAFQSAADNLVAGDANGQIDVFVKDLATGAVTLVSAGGDGPSALPVLSADGRVVAFQSAADNLVAGDADGAQDVFVADLAAGTLTLASAGPDGPADRDALNPALSGDGRFVAFATATPLLPGDGNDINGDVYRKDLATGALTLVSTGPLGQGNYDSGAPALSRDGGTVAFVSYAFNLVPDQTEGVNQVFVKHLPTGALTLASTPDPARPSATPIKASRTSRFSVSGTGRYVAFQSDASNLVPGDTNRNTDVFVKDMATGRVTLVSAGPFGQADAYSANPALSADGRYVAFMSQAGNLVADDANYWDIFVKDLATGRVTLVSTGPRGQADGPCDAPSISADGRYVAFRSAATNLVDAPTTGSQIYVKDLVTGAITLASAGPDGPGNRDADAPALSADGRVVAFQSHATNLAAGDTNGQLDVFVKDLTTGQLTLASAGPTRPGNGFAAVPTLSGNGRFVAFATNSTNLGGPHGFNSVVVKDLTTGAITLASAGPAGPGNGIVFSTSLSRDGRRVAFATNAGNLADDGDGAGVFDVFVKDLTTGAVTQVSAPPGGPANGGSDGPSLSADGRFVAFFSAADNLMANDSNGATDVFLAAVDVPPTLTAHDGYAGTRQDAPLNDAVVAAGPAGGPLTYRVVTRPAHGTVTFTDPAAGTYTYTPAPGYHGPDGFTFQATDGQADSNVAAVALFVVPPHRAPVAGDRAVRTPAGVPYVFSATDFPFTDPDDPADPLRAVVVTEPPPAGLLIFNGGAVQPGDAVPVSGIRAGRFAYHPAGGSLGPVAFRFAVRDAGGTLDGSQDTSAPQTFTLTLVAVNAAPTFTPGPDVTVSEDAGPQTLPGWATDIRPGPADEAGQWLTFDVRTDNPELFAVPPALAADGTLTFTPASNANGTALVTIRLRDDGGTADGGVDVSREVQFVITVAPVNDSPWFVPGANQAVREDAGPRRVRGWATDIVVGPTDEVRQTFTFVVTTNNPRLFADPPKIAADGTLTYTPAANARGMAKVTVVLWDNGGTADDGVNTSPAASFTITVAPVNDAPRFARGPSLTVAAGPQVRPGWATRISAGPGEAGQRLAFRVTTDRPGLFAAAPTVDARGTLRFTPAANARGTARVTVVLRDDGGTAAGGVDTSPAQTFTITVTPTNRPPVIRAPAGPLAVNNRAPFRFIGAAGLRVVDPDGGYRPLGVTLSASAGALRLTATAGLVRLLGNGGALLTLAGPPAAVNAALASLVYLPAAGAVGSATVTVTATDFGGPATTAVVRLRLTAPVQATPPCGVALARALARAPHGDIS